MNCQACGIENAPAALFCSNCGAGLTLHCSHCNAELPAGAKFCPACGQPVARAGAAEIKPSAPASSAERKQVTILFADFSGFTVFTARQDVEEVHEYMVSRWERLDAIILAHGGIIEKHIGDAIMAVFGARQARENDPEQAVRAGLAMQACLLELQATASQPALQLRVGIHTGLVVLGPIGGPGQVGVTGDAVNVANRLEQNAPVGKVLISQDTFRQVYGIFNVQEMPPLSVKGKTEPLQTYLVLGARPRSLARTLRGVEGVATRMIGRESELARLQTAFQHVMEERHLQMVTVLGEAGIGKSCLLGEFQKWVEQLPQSVLLFRGRATEEMTGLPFSLIRDVFASRFEIQESDSAAVARQKFARGLIDLLGAGADLPPGLSPEHEAQAHFIGQLLGLDFSASPHLRDLLRDPEQIRHRAFHYLSQFFTAVGSNSSDASRTPSVKAVLLIVEDVHWSDDGSLDLIDHLARTCGGVSLMIICLARPTLFERRSAWGEGLHAHTRLALDSLSRRDSRALVESILCKAADIPQALRELIVGGAEGNPFYIEEIIKMLIDQKVILPGDEQWRIEPERLAAARVPATLTGVLQARLDGLTPRERGVLQRASVVGRVFWDSAVERLSDPSERPQASTASVEGTLTKREILEALTALRSKELIFRRESTAFAGAVEYTFKHELLRTVTYEGVLKKLRREHHAQIANWLIDHSGERIGEFNGLVALHFEQAGRVTDAAHWYGQAGRQARNGFAPALAIECFRKALQSLPPPGAPEKPFQLEALDWYEGLGETLAAQAHFDQAGEAYTSMRDLAISLGDSIAQARAWNGLAFLHERQGDYRASIEAADRAAELSLNAGPLGVPEQIKALHLKGWAFYRLGDAPTVLALGAQTQTLCAGLGDRRGMATSYKLHGVAHLQLGHYVEADRYFEQGLALYSEFGDRRNAAAMWSNLGESARLRGDFQAATDLYQKALAIVRQIGHRESEIIYLTNLSGARLGLQHFKQAEADLREVLNLTATPNSCVLSETFSFLARACLGQHKLSEALSAARQALTLAQQSESYLDLGGAWRVLGDAAARLLPGKAGAADGEPPAEETGIDPGECFRESLRVFELMNAEGEQAQTLLAWAEFDLEQGRSEESQKRSAQARDIFLRLGMISEAEETASML